MSPLSAIAGTLEVILLFSGLAVLWRRGLSRAARAQPAISLLPTWEIPPINFLFFLWALYAGGFLLQFLVFRSLRSVASLTPEVKLIFASVGSNCGMILAWVLAKSRLDNLPDPVPAPSAARPPVPWRAGGLTFLAAWPVILAVMFVWQNGLIALGFPLEKQESIDFFLNAKNPLWLAFLAGFVVILGPITEELVYRGAIFRYVRGRLPRWLAVLGPACLFSAMHQNLASFAPLVMLAVFFSIVYERTGDIRVTMIAHGLFNLNTALLVLAGLG